MVNPAKRMLHSKYMSTYFKVLLAGLYDKIFLQGPRLLLLIIVKMACFLKADPSAFDG
jgi:hypothetical protein